MLANSVETWNKEYSEAMAIPSSTRTAPSETLASTFESIDIQNTEVIVELGCGNGRNLSYLADIGSHVVGVDFSAEALARARQNIEKFKNVDILQGDVTELPLLPNSVDLLIDSYMSCHFIRESTRERYLSEIQRVATSRAYLYWAGLSVEDEYYRQFIEPDNTATDPLNSVTKQLFTPEKVCSGFGRDFRVVQVTERSFDDIVNGNSYERKILVALYCIK